MHLAPRQKILARREGGSLIALRHVASFCISMGDDNDLISQRFHRLALALFDVQFGSKPELFKGGAASEGRLADPSDVWHMRCRAALILELLVQTEMSEERRGRTNSQIVPQS